jgi:hypothetical protein
MRSVAPPCELIERREAGAIRIECENRAGAEGVRDIWHAAFKGRAKEAAVSSLNQPGKRMRSVAPLNHPGKRTGAVAAMRE